MARADREPKFDHVVSVMFENRSFDSLLGRLYQPGEVASFDGVIDKDLSNPIPEWADDRAGHDRVPYEMAANMDAPNPDAGEEYQHVNIQLFGLADPPSNRAAQGALFTETEADSPGALAPQRGTTTYASATANDVPWARLPTRGAPHAR